MRKKHFPMWGGNDWTKSMYKKYWFVIVVIMIGCVIVIIEINEQLDFFSYEIIANEGDDSASGTATRN